MHVAGTQASDGRSMARQHATPLLLTDGAAVALSPLSLAAGPDAVSEAAIKQLIHDHPSCLPIAEIDPTFCGPVSICTELSTMAGPIDNFMVTPSGLPVLVECKLWRNPEMRRQVVSQILDYAKELSRWSSSDLQREASRRLGRPGNALLDLVREAGHEVDEADFNDALTANLRRGRFLLLIVGDGIREGVEAIAEYLQAHAGLHFTLGLVELPIFAIPDGSRIVVPRVLTRTVSISREVVAVPQGFVLQDGPLLEADDPEALSEDEASRRDFMRLVVDGLVFDDPEQPPPRVTPKGWLFLYMPAPASSCWIGVLDKRSSCRVGVRLTSNIGTVGEAAIRLVVQDWEAISEQLGPSALLEEMGPGRFRVHEFLDVDRSGGGPERAAAAEWIRRRLREYVSIFRPRIRDAVEQLREQS